MTAKRQPGNTLAWWYILPVCITVLAILILRLPLPESESAGATSLLQDMQSSLRDRRRAMQSLPALLEAARTTADAARLAEYQDLLSDLPPLPTPSTGAALDRLTDEQRLAVMTALQATDRAVSLGSLEPRATPVGPSDSWWTDASIAIREQLQSLDEADNVLGRTLVQSTSIGSPWGEDSRAVRLIAIALVVLVALAWLGTAALLDRRRSRELNTLIVTARTVTDGDLSARAVVHDDGPVSELAKDINVMIDVLVETLGAETAVIDELRQKAAALESANRHKSQFVATVSHELKTPLNAIIGFADILAEGPHGSLNERQRDYCRRIFAAGNHLLAMISDLIDISKIDTGQMALKPTEFAIQAAVDEVAEMIRPMLDAKGQSLGIQVQPGMPTLLLDYRRVVQILLNLLSNAVKFTPEEGTIQLDAALVADRLQVAVVDSGIGIAAADHDRIFDDFVQLDSALHRKHEGTGIGLALSRRLAAVMGGTLQVSSEPGRGSRFVLTLPLSSPTLPNAPSASSGPPPASAVLPGPDADAGA